MVLSRHSPDCSRRDALEVPYSSYMMRASLISLATETITMTNSKKSYRTYQYTRSLRYVLLAAGLWCISLFASISILAPQQVYARSDASTPGGDTSNPAIRAVDIAKPDV